MNRYGFQVERLVSNGQRMMLFREQGIKRSELNPLQLRMLGEQNVPGLLALDIEEVDFDIRLVYDITSLRPLQELLENGLRSAGDILDMLRAAALCVAEGPNYMLDELHFAVDAELIYIGRGWSDTLLVYAPLSVPLTTDPGKDWLRLIRLFGERLTPADRALMEPLAALCEEPGFSAFKLLKEIRSVSTHQQERSDINGRDMALSSASSIPDLSVKRLERTLHTSSGIRKDVYPPLYCDESVNSGGGNGEEISTNTTPLVERSEPERAAFRQGSVHNNDQTGKSPPISESSARHSRAGGNGTAGGAPNPASPGPMRTERQDAPAPSSPIHGTDASAPLKPPPHAADAGRPEQPAAAAARRRTLIGLAAALPALAALWSVYAGDPRAALLYVCGGCTVLALDAVWAYAVYGGARRKGARSATSRPGAEAQTAKAADAPPLSAPEVSLDQYYAELGGRTTLLANAPADRTVYLGDYAAGEDASRMPTLEVYRGGKKETILIDTSAFIIGRGENDVQYVEDAVGVSRVHAELFRTGNGYSVKDLGSRNGTYLNGQPLIPYQSYPLSSGDIIRLVRTEFIYRAG